MGRLWSTLALTLILAGLGGYIFLVEIGRDPDAGEAREPVFEGLEAEAVAELQVRGSEGDPARLTRTDDTWRLVEPVEAAANEAEASSIASNLASLEIDRVVDEAATDLAPYGLEPARIDVGFRAGDDQELRHLLVGGTTPTGGNLYATVGGTGRVFLIASYLASTFDKNAFTLRDRRILVFDRDAVDGLTVEGESGQVTLAKSGAEWQVTAPIEARADFAAVEGALQRLSSTQMQGLVTEGDSGDVDLGQYGLARPTGTITVSAGSAEATLTLGSTDNALVFARDSSRPVVFTVAPTIRDDVIRTVADFRRKDLFDGRSFTATRLELTRGDETIVLEKSEDEESGTTWHDGDGETVETTAVEGLLSTLTTVRAESFESSVPAALRSPALRVTLAYGEDRTETVTFGRAGEDAFASRADEPGTARIAATTLDDALTALDEVR
jgi:hypothetical protein